MRKPVLIDLFCGAGGMSEGFRQAGFHVACGIDIDKDAGATHERNFPEAVLIQDDIQQLSVEQVLERLPFEKEEIDIIIGGFPCQGFSMAGKRWVDDPRNQLFKEFVKMVNGIRPKVFVAENVVGLVSMAGGQFVREIKEAFNEIGYNVEVQIMNSANYGVPQKRQRAIFIGNRIGAEITFPIPTHFENPAEGQRGWLTVEEAIGDLPLLGDEFGENLMSYEPTSHKAYQRYMRGELTFQEYLDGIEKEMDSSLRPLHNHWTSKSKGLTLERFRHIPQGCNWSALPEGLKTSGKYSNLYKRFHPDEPAVTLTNIRKSMFIHPIEDRLLTTREGARIQSFPDYMIFEGNLGSQQQQIGNAVPPLLGYAIAKHVLETYLQDQD